MFKDLYTYGEAIWNRLLNKKDSPFATFLLRFTAAVTNATQKLALYLLDTSLEWYRSQNYLIQNDDSRTLLGEWETTCPADAHSVFPVWPPKLNENRSAVPLTRFKYYNRYISLLVEHISPIAGAFGQKVSKLVHDVTSSKIGLALSDGYQAYITPALAWLGSRGAAFAEGVSKLSTLEVHLDWKSPLFDFFAILSIPRVSTLSTLVLYIAIASFAFLVTYFCLYNFSVLPSLHSVLSRAFGIRRDEYGCNQVDSSLLADVSGSLIGKATTSSDIQAEAFSTSVAGTDDPVESAAGSPHRARDPEDYFMHDTRCMTSDTDVSLATRGDNEMGPDWSQIKPHTPIAQGQVRMLNNLLQNAATGNLKRASEAVKKGAALDERVVQA